MYVFPHYRISIINQNIVFIETACKPERELNEILAGATSNQTNKMLLEILNERKRTHTIITQNKNNYPKNPLAFTHRSRNYINVMRKTVNYFCLFQHIIWLLIEMDLLNPEEREDGVLLGIHA